MCFLSLYNSTLNVYFTHVSRRLMGRTKRASQPLCRTGHRLHGHKPQQLRENTGPSVPGQETQRQELVCSAGTGGRGTARPSSCRAANTPLSVPFDLCGAAGLGLHQAVRQQTGDAKGLLTASVCKRTQGKGNNLQIGEKTQPEHS